MITTNVIHRTFHIRYGESTGTAFAIDRDDRQYLITARHVVDGIASGDHIGVFHDMQWEQTPIEVVGIGTGVTDVTVLAYPVHLAPPLALEATAKGIAYGQQVYFLGFPFGWDGGQMPDNNGYPMPFVKTGIVSAITFGDTSQIYVDAHNNKGFSGGPLVFHPSSHQGNKLCVAGVVVHYPTPVLEPVVNSKGEAILNGNGENVAYFKENQGLLVAIDIRHVTDLIDENPIGYELPIGEGS